MSAHQMRDKRFDRLTAACERLRLSTEERTSLFWLADWGVSADNIAGIMERAAAQLDEQQETLGRIAALYNGFVNSNPPAWGADATLAAIGDALGPPWQDSRLSPRDLRRCRFCGEIRAKHDPETRRCRVGTAQRFWPVGEPGGG